MFIIKTKLKFKDDKNCLEAAAIEIKINHLEKNRTYVDSLKEFKKTNKLILKKQQRFRSQRRNAFTEEINKIALNSNHGKRIKSIDSIETYVYGKKKDLICKKDEIKCTNIIKQKNV